MTQEPRQRHQTRRRHAAQIDTSVPSPCQALCQVDQTQGLCLGCRRTLDEIRDWIIMSAKEKQDVWDRLNSLPKPFKPHA